jgi:hypothetical protein
VTAEYCGGYVAAVFCLGVVAGVGAIILTGVAYAKARYG